MIILLPHRQAVCAHEQLKTPLFLRFINMMINDATVQLDEGLDVSRAHCLACILGLVAVFITLVPPLNKLTSYITLLFLDVFLKDSSSIIC